MLLFKEAKGDIVIDGRRYPLHRQKVFILSPNASVKLLIHSDDPADYYYIPFQALQAAADLGHFAPAELKCPDELSVMHFNTLIEKVHEMKKKQLSGIRLYAMEANILFQELLVALFKNAVHEQKPDYSQAITLTLDYMEQNYRFPVTREKLAEMAGMSADYYSRVFRKKTGKSPMEYLTEIRINQARQLLVQSGDSFRSIAHSVGFSDEFYFSRKFKATTGRSPTAYVKQIRYSEKIASLKHLPTGHLIALGIEPYAAIINNAYPVTSRFRNTITVGDSMPDLEKLMAVKPDLIVTCESRDFGKSPKEKMFDHIAPTVTLPFFQNWRIHFQTVAKIVGKEKEANDWLEHYERKAETIRKQIKQKIGDDTVLIVGIGDGKMCVYGQRNIGTVLYGDLQLAVPKGAEEIAHYKEIYLEDLFAFEADRILLTSYKHDGTADMDHAIRNEASALFANKQWRALKAVRNRAVYCMYDSRHLYTCYSSLSHDLLLDKAHQLFMPESSK
ncbi:helix-turn-helix domain-containing protein [uncultured Paenibacillus sp.]|uniref:helix-turn-helix domain-containing protein n=1 Tax=uncultured Paenibacillus sp. TaxID=227322 RepID=UPI0028D1D4BD|nr:helix-turn-helix domain-containing protein [uncultured Paenibacillus sp.]